MQSVAIYGAKGTIGKRWVCVFNWLGCKVVEIDIDATKQEKNAAHACNYAVIATPTSLHLSFIRHCLKYDYERILCEKPLSVNDKCKDLQVLKNNPRVIIVNNWNYVDKKLTIGKHIIDYNYFNSGKGELYENFFQPLAYAEQLEINTSPIFKVKIDKVAITQAMFDKSYIELASRFIKGEKCGFDYEEYCKAVKNAKMMLSKGTVENF